MSSSAEPNYALEADAGPPEIPAPDLPYRPPMPRSYRPRLGLIGCGGITSHHLEAYRDAGWEVAAFCDCDLDRARARRDAFNPAAPVDADARAVFESADIDVVDLALHPEARGPLMAEALRAGKHVLSQKPFVTDLAFGAELVELARRQGVKLAVNQNGRWAPYQSWARHAVAAGLLGEVQSVAIRIHWDHTWTQGTPFEDVPHLVLFDFGIHWFDLAAQLFAGRPACRVTAHVAPAPGQALKPPLLAQAMIQFDRGLASLDFDAHTRFGPEESLVVTGTRGTLRARGRVLECEQLELWTAEGVCRPRLEGRWFNDGFRGAMGELLCAIEEKREPANSGDDNLRSLALCLAALRAADTGFPQEP
ncbi:MAG: Gfo/Idh/MocA family oxidoreductase [Verrucomicrobiales bacterium]|nr:Gfo/Idh/MocA family oxidoreductase [Verrucomicrobiales bacterium]